MALLITAGLVSLIFIVIIIEIWVAMSGRPPVYINPGTESRTFNGFGRQITYVVMGDSTAAGEGVPYEKGIAVGSAEHLASNHSVKLTNLAMSGAKAIEVARNQLEDAVALKPDVVLVSVGANDVIGRTKPASVRDSMEEVTKALLDANCDVKIVITGAPDMGSIPRFAQPLRTVAGWQTKRLNNTLYPWASDNNFTLAAIAAETGPAFRKDHSLFGDDRFHPNASGYAVWLKTINAALDKALADQPSHCNK